MKIFKIFILRHCTIYRKQLFLMSFRYLICQFISEALSINNWRFQVFKRIIDIHIPYEVVRSFKSLVHLFVIEIYLCTCPIARFIVFVNTNFSSQVISVSIYRIKPHIGKSGSNIFYMRCPHTKKSSRSPILKTFDMIQSDVNHYSFVFFRFSEYLQVKAFYFSRIVIIGKQVKHLKCQVIPDLGDVTCAMHDTVANELIFG